MFPSHHNTVQRNSLEGRAIGQLNFKSKKNVFTVTSMNIAERIAEIICLCLLNVKFVQRLNTREAYTDSSLKGGRGAVQSMCFAS